jgi:hypothetical protein
MNRSKSGFLTANEILALQYIPPWQNVILRMIFFNFLLATFDTWQVVLRDRVGPAGRKLV